MNSIVFDTQYEVAIFIFFMFTGMIHFTVNNKNLYNMNVVGSKMKMRPHKYNEQALSTPIFSFLIPRR